MSCENVSIRNATFDDLDEILALLSRVNLPSDGVVASVEGFLVARDQTSQLVATIGLERHGDTGLLRSAAVAPEFQGSGVGSLLTRRLLERARNDGIERVVLLTTTAKDFFARRFGFREAARSMYEEVLGSSSEWNLPRCSSAVCMSVNLRSDLDQTEKTAAFTKC